LAKIIDKGSWNKIKLHY